MRVFGLVALASVFMAGTAGVVAAQEEPLFGPMAPARVNGSWIYTGDYEEGQVEQLGELMYVTTGRVTNYEVTSSDPRLQGSVTVTGDLMGAYPPALVSVVDRDWLLEAELGTWTGTARSIASMADEDPINVEGQVILDGTGAYEGLTAYLVVDHDLETFVGAIIPDEMPELPADWLEIYQSAYEEEPASDG